MHFLIQAQTAGCPGGWAGWFCRVKASLSSTTQLLGCMPSQMFSNCHIPPSHSPTSGARGRLSTPSMPGLHES